MPAFPLHSRLMFCFQEGPPEGNDEGVHQPRMPQLQQLQGWEGDVSRKPQGMDEINCPDRFQRV